MTPVVILYDDMLEELIQTRLTRQLKTAFEEAAKREGRPASELLRLLIAEWVERMHPDLLVGLVGGELGALEGRPAQEMAPTQPVYPVLCWRCHGRIDWRLNLGPQGFCPYCGAFIDLRVK